MKTIRFNENWKFWEVTNSFALNWAPPEDARILDLPHDAMIEVPQDPDCKAGANTGYRKGGVYSYSKSFYADNPDRTYILKIEGAYMNAFVYVNGQLAAKRPFGYSVFYVPMNRYLEFGRDNEIRIQVRSGAEPNSRWYPGTGLYRDVYLLESGSMYIKPDSVMIKTLSCNKDTASLNISALIANRSEEEKLSLEINIQDAAGKAVFNGRVPVEDCHINDLSASELSTTPLMMAFDNSDAPCNEYFPADTDIQIRKPLLWDADLPNLYTCTLNLRSNTGKILDTHTDSFGIRTLSVNAEEGFRVNGKEVKLRGACIHHDSGMLGSKTYEEVHIRQIQKLKESGFNAIRCAHNPAAPALLRACDKVGMYVMDESFDIWTRHKSDYDYGLFFEEWWEADVEAMVRNDFNHPSVIMYSIGNEIPEIGTDQGGRIAQNICDVIKSLDDTRFTLASVNGIFSVGDELGKIVADVAADLASQGKMDGNVNDFMAFMHTYMNDMTSHPIVDQIISVPFLYTDIAGYNYMGSRYDIEHELHPDRVIVGSETGIGDICYNWERVKKYPYVIGDFCWTGWEYLGEAGIGSPNYSNSSNPFGNASFPLQISGTGCIDITGHRLAMSYYREIVFGLRKDPYIAVQDPAHYGEELIHNPWIISDAIGSWSWSSYTGKPVVIEVYSGGDEVELFKNGVSLGRKPAGEAAGYMTIFETTYEPGTLKAVTYTRKNHDAAAANTVCVDEAGAAAPMACAGDETGDTAAITSTMKDPGDRAGLNPDLSGNAETDDSELFEETGCWEISSAGSELRIVIEAEPVYSTLIPVLEQPEDTDLLQQPGQVGASIQPGQFGMPLPSGQFGTPQQPGQFGTPQQPGQAQDFAGQAQDGSQNIFSDLINRAVNKDNGTGIFSDLIANSAFSSVSGSTDTQPGNMMNEYQSSRIKSREFTEQLKEAYRSGNTGKPELVLDISQSHLVQQAAGSNTAPGSMGAMSSDTAAGSISSNQAGDVVCNNIPAPEDTEEFDIRFINIKLADENGVAAADQDSIIKLDIEGPAEVLAFGSADPKPAYNYNELTTRTYQGRAQLILKTPKCDPETAEEGSDLPEQEKEVSASPISDNESEGTNISIIIKITSDSGLEGTLTL